MIDDDTFLKEGKSVRGRGTGALPKSRFDEKQALYEEEEASQVETQVFTETARSILAYNDSPDIGFTASINPYRGCEHGCIYCYARPTHEYVGLSAGLDFETRIFAKTNAPKLLEAELRAKSWQPQVIGFSGVTDCYQPTERKLKISRGCLEVLAKFRNPVVVITKNYLVTRDIEVLQELARYNAARVVVSFTTLDKELARKMEPRASRPELRLRAVKELHEAGIPVSVNIAPIVPGLTDHEIPTLLKAAAQAGADSAHYTMLRLPYGVKDLFADWLETHYPLRKEKVLHRVRGVRGGKLYSAEFGSRMKGEGIYAEQVAALFRQAKKNAGFVQRPGGLSVEHFRREPEQFSLF